VQFIPVYSLFVVLGLYMFSCVIALVCLSVCLFDWLCVLWALLPELKWMNEWMKNSRLSVILGPIYFILQCVVQAFTALSLALSACIRTDIDDQLFNKTVCNSKHVLHTILPPPSTASQHYHIRCHSHTLPHPEHVNHLSDCNSINVCAMLIMTTILTITIIRTI